MIRNLNYFAMIALIVALMGCKKDETKKVTPEPVTLPTITDFNPKAAMAGESVMITGANFGSDTNQVSVKFGSGASAKPKSVSNSEMTIKVPTGAQSGKIQITVGGKSVSTAASFSLNETPTPAVTITGFQPLSAASGDSVIVTGTGFGSDANFVNIIFGKSQTAVKPKSISPTKMVVLVPDDATTGDLSVSVNGATAAKAKDQFTLKTLPLAITSLSTNSGKVGTEVTITGSGFGSDVNAVKVYFGGSDALKPNTVSSRQLVVTVPESANTGKVKVSLNSGASVTSSNDFTVSLSITSFSPKSGTVGDTIVLKGASFTNINDMSVFLNATSTTAVKPIRVSLHELAFKVPSLAKTGKIRITASTGADISMDDFGFQDQLRISDFYSPVSWDYVTDLRINSIVRIQGSFNTTDINDIGVSFGGSSIVHPLMIKGSDIYVGLPSDAKSGKLTVSATGFVPYTSTKELKILPVQKSGPWLRITDFVSTGRSNAMAFVIGSKVYVTGGQNQAALGTDYLGDLWEFDTSNGIWLKKSDFRGGARYAGVSFTIGSTGYVGTGVDQSGNVKSDLWAYDASTNAWTQKADLPGEGRSYAVGFIADGKGYVGTGLNASKKSLNDFYRYDPSTNSWTQIASISGARSQAFAFVINNKGYVGNGTGTSNLQMYDPSTNTWTAKAGIPSYTSIGGAAFSINGKGYAGLGMQNTAPDKRVYEYNPSSDSWTALPDMGAVSVGGIGFAVGGIGYFGLGGGYNGIAPGVDIWTYKP